LNRTSEKSHSKKGEPDEYHKGSKVPSSIDSIPAYAGVAGLSRFQIAGSRTFAKRVGVAFARALFRESFPSGSQTFLVSN
jgi:hypothetical protein